MKNLAKLLFSLACTVFVAGSAFAQVTGLTVNGQTSGVTIQQGDMINWQITLPTGGTSQNELWLDINQNGLIDQGTDKVLFIFTQTDGGFGGDGPGDMDGTANGVITTTFAAGFAPASWVFKATHNSVSLSASFTVTALPSPAYTIAGTVSAPGGVDKANIVIEAGPREGEGAVPVFWQGLTNTSGNYTINMGGNPTTMNPWRVGTGGEEQNLGVYVLVPRETTFTVTGHHTGVNFQMVQGTVITGLVTDFNSGSPIADREGNPHFHDALNPFPQFGGETQFRGRTDVNGRYAFVALPGKYFMHFTAYHYFDQWWDHKTGGQAFDTITVTNQDTIANIDGSLTLGAVIAGRITNWGIATGAFVELYAQNDPNQSIATTNTDDDGTYFFTVQAGSYYAKFTKDTHVIYYNGMNSPPGDLVTVAGTNTVDNIDADFQVGPPPAPPAPQIISIRDVPNDQGKHVFVTWRGNEPEMVTPQDGPPVGVEKFSIWQRWNGVWTFVVEVPARRDSVYAVVAETIIDSTVNNGIYWSKFQVSSHFSYNYYVVSSPVDSGYSRDNLVPNVPGGVMGIIAGADLTIRWRTVPDEDFQFFAVYRSTTPNFDVSGLTPFARVTDTSYTDVGVVGGTTYYYRVTALDFSGNQSAPSTEVSNSITGVEDAPVIPNQYALYQNFPNPFNPLTQITYDILHESFVTLKVFNMLGQEVATVVQGEQNPGRYTVTFDSKGLASGLYVYKITANNYVSIRKMNLIK